MRRAAVTWLACVVLTACGGGTSTAPTSSTTAAATTPSTTGPIVPSEGALNGPPPAATTTSAPDVSAAFATPGEREDIISVAPNFQPDPIVRRGLAGGPVSAEERSSSCRGYIPTAPSIVLKVDVAMPLLRVLVHSQGDATLLVELADGRVLCNDDAEGLDPIVQGALPPGRHRVYVGTYGRARVGTPYSLAITTQPSLRTHALDALPETR